MKRVYIEYATPRNLKLHRGAPMWEHGVYWPRKKGEKVYTAVAFDAADGPRGYVVYRTAENARVEPGPDQVLTVQDWAALDMDAYHGLGEYLRRHDLVREVEFTGGAEDDPAPDLLLEPRVLQRHTSDQMWLRVVDVPAALGRRPYATSGSLTFRIEADSLCPWNEGTWRLDTDGEEAKVSATSAPPQLVIPTTTLAGLFSGLRRATHYARAGRLDVRDARALEMTDALFLTAYRPHLPEPF